MLLLYQVIFGLMFRLPLSPGLGLPFLSSRGQEGRVKGKG